jgi:uncharacterized protein (TIGR00369 family)
MQTRDPGFFRSDNRGPASAAHRYALHRVRDTGKSGMLPERIGLSMDKQTSIPGVVSQHTLLAQDGVAFLQGIIDGKFPPPPIAETLGFRLMRVEKGRVQFEGEPKERHYNPIGSVHGGFAMTLLDSALACAVHSTLAAGEAYTSLEIKVNFVRPLSALTGPVIAEGRVIHRGRTIGTSEGDLKDRAGKIYAHATTTCMIFPAKS